MPDKIEKRNVKKAADSSAAAANPFAVAKKAANSLFSATPATAVSKSPAKPAVRNPFAKAGGNEASPQKNALFK